MQPFPDPAVKAAFEAFAPELQGHLLALRQRIFDAAAGDPLVGPLQETLKWGQPAYLTSASKSGTTLRLGTLRSHPQAAALFVHCQTTLIASYRALYAGVLLFEGNRAVVFPVDNPLPVTAVDACIRLALTYHLNKRRDGLPF